MSGINSGILKNASPLSAEAIKELERKVLETGEAYAYLDQNSKLCFAMPHGVDSIKKLAWNSAYTINNPIKDGPYIRQAYKKTGLESSIADKLFTKSSINADWAEYDFTKVEADYKYTVTNGEATITSYVGDGGDIIIPNRLGGYPVVAIGDQSFTFTNYIKSIIILNGIKRIGEEAFYNCGMRSIHIPNSVTSIGMCAFDTCYNLKSIQFPGSIEYIPIAVCAHCEALESVIIANGTTSIGIYAFQNCDNIISLAIPKSLVSIGEGAFDCCDNITDIYYSGVQAQWNAIYIEMYNECLATATIHYNTSADAIQPTERLEGDGQEFYTAAPSTLSFRSTAPLNEFQEVQINGQTVDPSNYTLEEGSTIVKFSIDYLNTLDAGTHSVAIVSKNKTASGQFNVQQPKVNEYGFCYNTPYAIPAEMASVAGSHACVILTDKQLDWLDEPLPLAIVCINNAYRGFGLYRIEGQTLNLVTFDETLNLSVQVISPYELLAGMDVDGEYQQLPMALNGDPVYYASDGAHLYVLNDDEESYAASSVGLAMDKPYPILTGVNDLPTTTISSRGYEGVAYPGCLEIPNTVTEIGEQAFAGLSASVRIPNSVESIGHATFLEYLSIIYIDSLEHWCGINFDGQPILAGAHIYINDNPVDGELVIPDSVPVISPSAFVDYNTITSIVLPVTTARLTNAFGGSNLQTIVYKGTVAQWNALPKDEDWHSSIFTVKYVQCSDGQVAI